MVDAPILIAALVIAAIWGIYLFPTLFGNRRNAPLSSTEEFDRWTHVMSEVQRRDYTSRRVTRRDVVRSRRRRTLLVLSSIAAATLAVAYWQGSVGWLLGHLFVDALLAWYIGMLMQIRQREAARTAREHMMRRPNDADEPPIRIVAGG